jgi:threonine 3-dehydrogenase
MKGLIKESLDLDGLTLKSDLPVLTPAPWEVKIKVLAASVCGTDKNIYKSKNNPGIKQAMTRYLESGQAYRPIVIGHEFCGIVEAVGEQEKVKNETMPSQLLIEPGDYVTAEMHISCGRCNLCRNGNEHICSAVKVKGVHMDGCFAESVVVPYKNVIVLGKAGDQSLIPPHIASLLDAFGNAVHCVQEADVRGKSVAVLGAGPLGLMITLLCRHFGAAKVLVTEVVDLERRFALAREFGAEQCFDVSKGPEKLYKAITSSSVESNGLDVVFEVSGAAAAYNDAFKIVRNGGLVILLGLADKPLDGFDIAQGIVFKGATVKGIFGRKVFETWQMMRHLLATERLALKRDLAKIVAEKDYTFDNYEEAFATLIKGQEMKLVFVP